MQLQKVYNYSFLGIAMFPVLGLKLATKAIIIWALLAIAVVFKNKSYRNINRKSLRDLVMLSGYYLFLIANYVWSGFDDSLLKFLETGAPFLVFPLFIVLTRDEISNKTLHRSLAVFYAANTILALRCWMRILQEGFLELQAQNTFYKPVFRNLFSEVTGIHLPYLGLLFVFAIFIGFWSIKELKLALYTKAVLLAVNALLLASIVTFSARMALGIFVVGTLYGIATQLKSRKSKIAGVGLLTMVVLGLLVFTPIKARVLEIINTKMELPSERIKDEEHTVNFRYGIYHCALGIVKEHFWLGVGKQNVSKNMQACYNTFTFTGVNDFKNVRYNSHNQYLDWLMSFGIFGCLLLVISVFWGFGRVTNSLYVILLLSIALGLFTENLFARQIGVVFFTFFNTLFFINDTKQN